MSSTRELFEVCSTEKDVALLRSAFLASYRELEAEPVPMVQVVAAAFSGVDRYDPLVRLYRRTAMQIARHVDLGEDGTCANAYHNRLHFEKVLVNFRALATLHNAFYPDYALADRDIARGLLAATAHDLGHDGLSNTIKGQHQPFRLEQIAITMGKAWALPKDRSACEAELSEALALIYATDVSCKGGDNELSPALLMRSFYDGLPIAENMEKPRVSSTWLRDLTLCLSERVLAAGLLQDADVFSALFDEALLKAENARVGAEREKATGAPAGQADALWFLETMLKGRLTTHVARTVSGAFIPSQIAKLKANALVQGNIPQP